MGVAWTGSDEDFQGFIDEHGLTFPQITGAVEPELLDQIIVEAT